MKVFNLETKEGGESCRGYEEEQSPGIVGGLWGLARSGLISIQYLYYLHNGKTKENKPRECIFNHQSLLFVCHEWGSEGK